MVKALETMARLPMRTARPVTLRGIYSQPGKELRRLWQEGRLVRIAHGTYILRPDNVSRSWVPDGETAAMAYATTAFAGDEPVLYGISAARWWRAIPRPLRTAVIAAPHQHRSVELATGSRVIFTQRNTATLDAMPVITPLGPMLVTTPEQTLIDLVTYPNLGGLHDEALAAATAIVSQVNPDWVKERLAEQPVAIVTTITGILSQEGRP